MVQQSPNIERIIRSVEETGISVDQRVNGFSVLNQDMIFPFPVLTLYLSGTARSLYDMREMVLCKNDIAFIMPGHILRPLECSPDCIYVRVAVSSTLFNEVRLNTFSNDFEKFHYAPLCHLTDEQVEQMLANLNQLIFITAHTEQELPHRKEMILAHLAIAHEFLNLYRQEQDKQWVQNRHADIFKRFCDLVVAHYTESREIQFYADKLQLTPKYFSQIIRSVADGMSPGQWIEQYVTTQAKRLIKSNPDQTLKQTAYQLGFTEPSSFYRYFKHATGITAKEYKDSLFR